MQYKYNIPPHHKNSWAFTIKAVTWVGGFLSTLYMSAFTKITAEHTIKFLLQWAQN